MLAAGRRFTGRTILGSNQVKPQIQSQLHDDVFEVRGVQTTDAHAPHGGAALHCLPVSLSGEELGGLTLMIMNADKTGTKTSSILTEDIQAHTITLPLSCLVL